MISTHPNRKSSIHGIHNHEIISILIATADEVAKVISSGVIVILNQYGFYEKGKTIHSIGQIDHFKSVVDNCSIKVGGKKNIVTNNSFNIPNSVKDSSPCMLLRSHTDKE